MARAGSFQIVVSTCAANRLEAAAAFLRSFPASQRLTVVAATRAAADDLARVIAAERGATLGTSRFSLTQLAAHVAVARLGGQGIAPATLLGAEAVAARAAFDARRAGVLSYLATVAATPGFARALSRTIADLRMAGVEPGAVAAAAHVGPDLAGLAAAAARELAGAATADRAALFAVAADALGDGVVAEAPLLLLDVTIDSAAERRFVAALVGRAPRVLATVPAHDHRALTALQDAGGAVMVVPETRTDDLAHLRMFLFGDEAPPQRPLDGSLQFLSAPGEGRECIEIARRILREAGRGVRFDEMAILVRAPQHYHGLLEHALERAGVPAWYDRGTRRPHPAGRAFLALLACAAEGLSARRFAEYLSLGQLPAPGQADVAWCASTDEAFAAPTYVATIAGLPGEDGDADTDTDADADADADTDTDADADAASDAASAAQPDGMASRPALAGTLRVPRRWERMLVEAAVIGGGPERWQRRLDGLEAELTARRVEETRRDPTSPRIAGLGRELAQLGHLRHCALPLVTTMAAWPESASWGDWLEHLEALAPRVLRTPAYVLRVLADLRPMATVGPVSLNEVRGVLAERLRLVDSEPLQRRYGRVFVGTPAQARGRAFRVVFVPGLAERMFPQKSTQDPLLLDDARQGVDAGLETRVDRGRRERLLLHLAAGAACDRLYVSYPRLDVAEGRARVPSFYALDVLRGATGVIPDHETLAAAAAAAGDATLAWPAPKHPADAIDDQEHDLSVLRTLLDAADPASVRGHAQYMLRLNPALRRSVTERWARGERKWSQFDGLVRVTASTRAPLEQHRLGRRPYSLSALQRFAACPYQFLLSAIYRLHVAEQPQPLQRLDPLTVGSIVHRIQAAVLRELREAGELPVTAATARPAHCRHCTPSSTALPKTTGNGWHRPSTVCGTRRSRRSHATCAAGCGGVPRTARRGCRSTSSWRSACEADAERDLASITDPVQIDGRFMLRGAVDLVEEHRTPGRCASPTTRPARTGAKDTLIIGGGDVLQPVLYSLAVEQVTGSR